MSFSTISHTIHSSARISDAGCLSYSTFPPNASYVMVPCVGCSLFPTHATDVRTSAASRGLSCLIQPFIEVRELHEKKVENRNFIYIYISQEFVFERSPDKL